MSTALRVKSKEMQKCSCILFAIDVCSYRTRDEIKGVRKERDPITAFKQTILEKGLFTEEELKVQFQSILILQSQLNTGTLQSLT